MKSFFRLVCILAVVSLYAHAATIQAAGTKTVKACYFAVQPAAAIVSTLSYPANWLIVVVCNENLWAEIMQQKNINFVSPYAFTIQANHVTFIRAKWFVTEGKYTPRQILAHELGHIECKCDDETIAWDQAEKLMRGSPLHNQTSSSNDTLARAEALP